MYCVVTLYHIEVNIRLLNQFNFIIVGVRDFLESFLQRMEALLRNNSVLTSKQFLAFVSGVLKCFIGPCISLKHDFLYSGIYPAGILKSRLNYSPKISSNIVFTPQKNVFITDRKVLRSVSKVSSGLCK